jgi:hypothetical protein
VHRLPSTACSQDIFPSGERSRPLRAGVRRNAGLERSTVGAKSLAALPAAAATTSSVSKNWSACRSTWFDRPGSRRNDRAASPFDNWNNRRKAKLTANQDSIEAKNDTLWSLGEYHRLIERLALKVYESGWKFDRCCAWRAAACVRATCSRHLRLPLAICRPAPTAKKRHRARRPRHRQVHDHDQGPLAGRILLVDDLADSGVTLNRVRAPEGKLP